MPGKVRVKIIAGRNLPVMDRGSDTTDAYVEIKFATITYKTDVYRKSLNPQWNSDWYRFEVDDAELQDEPLQIRIMDHDTYSANDAIGKVNISLNPLLLPIFDSLGQKMAAGKGTVMSGWIPVFDTMHGIRGEVNLIVKVDLFSDVNKFRQSSCGVQFFHSPNIPYGYHAQIIHGFVEELVVNDDPEYQWIDKIRTPRASNEARQVVFLKLSGQVQRKIGLKAIDLGANAVIGYIQCFDLEGDVGVVARGIGTAVTLVKIHDATISMGIFNTTIQRQHIQQDPPAVIEERTRKYLEFLTNSNRNDGNCGLSKFDWSGYGDVSPTKTIPHNDRDIVYKILGLDPNEFVTNRQKTGLTKSTGGLLKKHSLKKGHAGIPEEEEEEEEEQVEEESEPEDGKENTGADDLNENIKILCSQEDHRSETSKTRLKRRMKHFGKTSKCIINRKMNVFKKSQPDSDSNNSGGNVMGNNQDSYGDIRGTSARNSMASSLINSSIVDIRSMFTRYPSQILAPSCKQQNPKFQRSASDGVGMAALLVRSLMVAAPSLDSIAEMNTATIQTTGAGSPQKTDTIDHNRETSDKICKKSAIDTNPKSSIVGLEQRKIKSNIKKGTTNKITNKTGSMINLSSTDNKQLLLSDEMIGHSKHFKISDSNLSSHFSSRTTMSSPEDDEEEDEDDEDSEDADDDDDDDDCESEVTQSELVIVDADTVSMVVKSVLAQEQSAIDGDWITPGDDLAVEGTTSPSASMMSDRQKSAPFGNIGQQQRKQSIDSHTDWIQPGSTIDEPEISSDTKRNSIFHDLKGNIRDKFHHLQEQLSGKHHHHHHEHAHEHHEIVENSLIGTALETMLVDKANVFGANPIITETTIVSDLECDQHLHKSNSTVQPRHKPRRSSSIDSIKRFIQNNPFQRKRNSSSLSIDPHSKDSTGTGTATTHSDLKDVHTANESSGLTNMAMRTMLMETVNLVEEVVTAHSQNPPSSSSSSSSEIQPDDNQSALCIKNTIDSINSAVTTNTPSTIDLGRQSNTRVDNNRSQSDIAHHQLLTKSSLIISDSCSFVDYANDENINTNNNNNNNNNNNDKNNIIHTTNITNKLPLLVSNPIQFDRSMVDSSVVVVVAAGGVAAITPVNNIHNNNNIVSAGVTSGGGGHIRADSVGCKGTNHSPIKMTTSTSSTVTTTSVNGGHPINGGGGGCGGGGGHGGTSGSIGSNSIKDSTICRRSSDSDLSVTPKGGSLNIGDRPVTTFGIGAAPTSTGVLRITGTTTLKTPLNQDNLDMLEYPFLTMTKYPVGFILHIGATVCARSVKLLERVPNPDEPETRDSWWTELRMEIRSHARALGCNVVLGYTELTTISDEVCVLSVTGTAAVINLQFTCSELALLDTAATNQLNGCTTTSTSNGQLQSSTIIPATIKDVNKIASVGGTVILEQILPTPPLDIVAGGGGGGVVELDTENNIITPIGHVTAIATNGSLKDNQDSCTMCHIPYTKSSVPFNVHMKRCGVCRHGKVPDVLLATIEIPENIQITGRGCFLQAQVYRNKKDLKSESNAKEISDGLPFLEYDLHRLLINKLKAKGMNAIFGLKSSIAIGEKMMALVATGTAVFLTALPPPNLPKIVAGNLWTNTEKLNDLKKSLQDTVDRNREIYQLKSPNEYEMHGVNGNQQQQQQQTSTASQFQSQSDDTDDSDDDAAEIDLTLGNKDTCVLEVDDIEDLEIISCLMEPCPPDGFHVVNTQNVPGLHDMDIVRNLQMFTQIWRTKFSLNQQCSNFPKHFQRLLQIIYFKLRTMVPCAIVDLKFRLDIPESEEVQILITGMALGLGDPNTKYNNIINTNNNINNNNISNNNNNNTTTVSSNSNSFGTMTKLNKRKIGVTSNQPQERSLLNKDFKKVPTDDELIFSLEEEHITDLSNSQQFNNTTSSSNTSGASSGGGGVSSKLPNQSSSPSARNNPTNKLQISIKERYGVDITPLSYVPGGKIDKYLGNLNFFFIRESTSIRENGGISGFVHSFITEVLAVARAHVTALGGNAMISFYMTELILVDNPHKNQGQCLISIGGDVVFVSYFTDD